jgi:hypothetical protein
MLAHTKSYQRVVDLDQEAGEALVNAIDHEILSWTVPSRYGALEIPLSNMQMS